MAGTVDGQGQAKRSLLRRLTGPRMIVGLVALVIAIIFVAENNQAVRIHFVFFTAHSRLWVGFLVSLVLGALLGQAFFYYRRKRGERPEG